MSTLFYNRNWRMPKSSNSSKVSNYSMSFDGTERINLENPIDLGLNNTTSIWVNLNSSYNGILLGEDSYTYDYFIYARASSPGFFVRIAATFVNFTDVITYLTAGSWHHLAIVRNGDSAEVFVDGISRGTNTGLGTSTNTKFDTIGAKPDGSLPISGKIDHVAAFDYALSASQITALYGNSTDGVGNPMAISGGRKPVAYYPIGDYAAFNGSEYLVNNGALQDYVFDFIPNDYITCGNVLNQSGTDAFSVSGWIKYDTTKSNTIVGKMNSSFVGYQVYINAANKLKFLLQGTGNLSGTGATALSANNWYHIVVTYDGSGTSSGINFYINGDSETFTGSGSNSGGVSNSANFQIGARTGTADALDGQLSNVQIFNTALSATGSNSVETLYNNGTPLSDMSGFTSLQGWWKLDASATFDGSNWSIPDDSSNSNTGTSSGMTAANLVQSDLNITTPYSKYSLDLDGTGDKITLNSSINTGNNYSVSFWLNPENVSSGNSYIFSDSTTSPYKGLALDQGSSTAGGFGNFYYYTGAVNIVNNTAILGDVWSHIVITFDVTGQEIKFYVNGVLDKTSTSVANIGTLINEFGIRTTGNAYNGKLSNISIWNTELSAAQVTEIYNNRIPTNLNSHSAYSNLVSWWQLGENSSFNTNWTVLDEKGTNNGTSANMTEADLVNGVGQTASGVSSGMGGADNIVGEAPYSTANAVSYGMGVDAKSTSVPS